MATDKASIHWRGETLAARAARVLAVACDPVIEVGAHNRYGHPAPSTLVALAHAVPKVLRTDRDGDVCVSLTGHDLAIVTRH